RGALHHPHPKSAQADDDDHQPAVDPGGRGRTIGRGEGAGHASAAAPAPLPGEPLGELARARRHQLLPTERAESCSTASPNARPRSSKLRNWSKLLYPGASSTTSPGRVIDAAVATASLSV